MQEWITIYVLVLGIVLFIMGAIDLAVPARVFEVWKIWVSKKIFFLHGLVLICAGLPLTLAKGPLAGLLFAVGIVPVLTGPFILIYPDKIRKMFDSVPEDISDAAIKKMVRIEGALLIAAGAICIMAFLLR